MEMGDAEKKKKMQEVCNTVEVHLCSYAIKAIIGNPPRDVKGAKKDKEDLAEIVKNLKEKGLHTQIPELVSQAEAGVEPVQSVTPFRKRQAEQNQGSGKRAKKS